MIAQIALDTLLVPLVIGVIVFLAGRWKSDSLSTVFIFALLLGAAIAYVNLESMPAWPPISSKDKMPYALVAGAIIFALWPKALFRINLLLKWIVLAVVSALPVLWIGINVIPRKPVEALVALVALLVVTLAGSLFSKHEAQMSRSVKVAQLAAGAWSLTGLALVCAFGAYVGMAQVSGAGAAMIGAGAALMVGLSLSGKWQQTSVASNVVYGIGALIVVYAGVTALFARHASLPAIVLAALCPLVPVLLARVNAKSVNGDGVVAHLVAAFAAGVPAVLATVLAALTFFSNQ